MTYIIPKYPGIRHRIGFVPALFYLRLIIITAFVMMTGVSCDLPPGWENDKGSLTLVLPGASASARNPGAGRAVHLPEEITDAARYALTFNGPGRSFEHSGSEKVVTVFLEPGRWFILVTALHGTSKLAFNKAEVDIHAGEEKSVSFTMEADSFLTPHTSSGAINKFVGTGSPLGDLSLSVEIWAANEFSGNLPGWVDGFSYRWYYLKDGTEYTLPGGSASAPDSYNLVTLANTALNSATGFFYYYVEITNSYTYTSPETGEITSDTATGSVYVGRVEVMDGTPKAPGDSGEDGGTIFYAAPAFYVNGQPCHYLEASPIIGGQLGPAPWGLDGINAGAKSSDYPVPLGRGYDYTQRILAILGGTGETGTAAQLATGYSGGVKHDWFLPSEEELDALYAYSVDSGAGLFGTNTLWSSTESSTDQARVHFNSTSMSRWREKTDSYHVRPIRAF
jgi:hypothetical protein